MTKPNYATAMDNLLTTTAPNTERESTPNWDKTTIRSRPAFDRYTNANGNAGWVDRAKHDFYAACHDDSIEGDTGELFSLHMRAFRECEANGLDFITGAPLKPTAAEMNTIHEQALAEKRHRESVGQVPVPGVNLGDTITFDAYDNALNITIEGYDAKQYAALSHRLIACLKIINGIPTDELERLVAVQAKSAAPYVPTFDEICDRR